MVNKAVIAVATGLMIVGNIAYAQTTTPIASLGFQQDSSKPEPMMSVSPLEEDTSPVTMDSQAKWQVYDSPIRQCTQGDVILPSSGRDLFGFLFHNTAAANITMSIQGWQRKQCQINFSEGANVLYCQFTQSELRPLMANILNADKFDSTSAFAQTLEKNCKATRLA